MPLTLTKPSEGTVGWSSSVNQNFTDLEDYVNSRRLPKRYVQGLRCRYSTTAAIIVEPGSCRDSTDVVDMTLAAETTLSLATLSAINGLDEKTLTGTGATTNGSRTLTGTSTLFLTEFGTRAMTGTIAITNLGSTVTGTSTKFLTEIGLHDLIGNSTIGYRRVTGITSNTSLATDSADTWSQTTSGQSPNCIENATVKCGSLSRRVNSIASNTSLNATATFTTTQSSQTVKAGSEVGTGWDWYYVWLVNGGSGTGLIFSTQRTTPYGVTGYTTYGRLIGAMRNDGSSNLGYFSSEVLGLARLFTVDRGDFLAAGSAAAFTRAQWGFGVPPISEILLMDLYGSLGTGAASNIEPWVDLSFDGSTQHVVSRHGRTHNGVHGSTTEMTLFVPRANGQDQAVYYRGQNSTSSIYLTSMGWVFTP